MELSGKSWREEAWEGENEENLTDDSIFCFDCDTFGVDCPSIGICQEGNVRFCDCIEDVPDNVRHELITDDGDDDPYLALFPCSELHPDAFAVESRTFNPNMEQFRKLGLTEPASDTVIPMVEYRNGWKMYYEDILKRELL